MTLITLDEERSGLSSAVTSLERQLCDMRADLEIIQTQLKADAKAGIPNSTKMLSDIRQWLRLAIEAEVQLEQRKKKEKGIVNGYALDIDAARDSIGCRLDRLRRARCPNGFPR